MAGPVVTPEIRTGTQSGTASGAPASCLVTPEMRAAIGGTVRTRRSYPVTASDVRRWAIAAHWPSPPPAHYLDPDADPVGPADLNPFAWACVEDSLAERGLDLGDPGWIETVLGIDPPEVTHQLNGAIDDEYVMPLRVGDTVRSRSTLADYQEKEGRLGPMLFTTIADTWSNQHGVVVKRASILLIRH